MTQGFFHPSTAYPPVTFDSDPRGYGAIGAKVPRGHRDFVMSRSELMRFAVNPWRWVRQEPEKPTTAMEWGTLVDCLTLTPLLFSKHYEIVPDTYEAPGMLCPKCGSVTDSQRCSKCKVERVKTAVAMPWNWNAEVCAAWRQRVEEGGKLPVKRDVLEEARIASSRLLEDPRIASLIECSKKQVLIHVEYRDKATGLVVQVKALPDLVPDERHPEYGRMGADLKTCNDGRPEKWERQVFDHGYAIQAALHLDAMNAVMGFERPKDEFLHAIQESDAPYAVGRRMLCDEFLTEGRRVYRQELQRYCRCVATGKWPGFDDEDNRPGAPLFEGWRLTQMSPYMIG